MISLQIAYLGCVPQGSDPTRRCRLRCTGGSPGGKCRRAHSRTWSDDDEKTWGGIHERLLPPSAGVSLLSTASPGRGSIRTSQHSGAQTGRPTSVNHAPWAHLPRVNIIGPGLLRSQPWPGGQSCSLSLPGRRLHALPEHRRGDPGSPLVKLSAALARINGRPT
jgi:hypothetical protein